MIKSTFDGEKKLLKAEERNIELMSDLKKAKDKIKRIEKSQKKNMGSSRF